MKNLYEWPGNESGYGTCDSPEQLAVRYPKYEGYVLFNIVYRSQQPEEVIRYSHGGIYCAGWGWRKWGDYCGNFDIDGNYYPRYLCEANGTNGYPKIDIQYVFLCYKNPSNGDLNFMENSSDESYDVYYLKDGKTKNMEMKALAFHHA